MRRRAVSAAPDDTAVTSAVPRLTETAAAVDLDIAPSGGSTMSIEIVVLKRPMTRHHVPAKRGTILRNVFPPGTWTNEVMAKANAEYQAYRAAMGICRSCPNHLNKWKHRCDECQTRERERRRRRPETAKPTTLAKGFKKRRASKFKRAARAWMRARGFKKFTRRKPKT